MQRKRTNKLRSGRNLTNYEFFTRVVRWLNNHFTDCESMRDIHVLLARMFKILRTRGKPEAIKYVKQLRLKLLQALEGVSSEELRSNKRTELKLPKGLGFLKFVKRDKIYPCIRLVLSTLTCFRTLRGDGTPSFSSIEKSPTLSRQSLDNIREDIVPFLTQCGLNPVYFGERSRKLDFTKFTMTVKQGPKGHALWTSYLDLAFIPGSLLESIGIVGGERLREDMSNYRRLIPHIAQYLGSFLDRLSKDSFRRLSVIMDKEGKNREIAILDYYSQQALRPLHKYLFKVLRRIPQDSTFDHFGRTHNLKKTEGSSYHSIDLSNATDRFPIDIQMEVLTVMFGSEYANAWKDIMVGYPFDYKGRKIFYRTGNPMGAYSSWSIFTLCHHFMVYLASKEANIPWSDCPYMLLGDDIVIADDKVADNYRALLERFDIPFSKEKSHQSPYLFEFAKRFVHDGTEISPFPLNGLFENRNQWLLAVGTIFEETYRKRWIPRTGILQVCQDFIRLTGYTSSYVKKKTFKLNLILQLREVFTGRAQMADFFRNLAISLRGEPVSMHFGSPRFRFLPDHVLLKSYALVTEASVTRLTSNQNRRPLGLIAEHLSATCYYVFGQNEDPKLFIRSCPIIQTFDETMEDFRRFRESGMDLESLQMGEYKTLMPRLSLPIGDESFYMRRKDVLMKTTSQLVDRILDVMQEEDVIIYFLATPYDVPYISPGFPSGPAGM
jgi:hypothetical protein